MAIIVQIHTNCANIESVHKGFHSSEQPYLEQADYCRYAENKFWQQSHF